MATRIRTGAHVWNLGTGQGYSVLEMMRDAWRWQQRNPEGYR